MTAGVIILTGSQGWNLCPKDGTVWTVNQGGEFRKTDMIFFMDRALYKATDINDPEAVDLLSKRTHGCLIRNEDIERSVMKVIREDPDVSVMTTIPFDDIPNNIVYPLDEVVEMFGIDFFGNSIDYMIAYALYKGYDDIHTYGINLGTESESKYEKSPTSFWAGMTMGLGCRFTIHGSLSLLLRTENGELYGYPTKQWIERDKGMQIKRN